MTFRSLFVERHETRGAAEAPHVTGAEYDVIASLNAYTWPVSLQAFSEQHGLSIEWVDNSWTRVCVDGSQLRAFLACGNDSATTSLAGIDDDGWFVINEEEF